MAYVIGILSVSQNVKNHSYILLQVKYYDNIVLWDVW